jgi:tetratricopeptide (TPR) repeat protein
MLIAERTEATDPAWLASFATTLRELSLSEGAIRIALDHLTAGSGHLDYLVRFIDAVPADLARMAGSLLGRFMLDRGQYEARAVADQLFLQPSPSDTAVVHAAAAWLWDNEDSDAEVQFAFLDQCWPHVRPLAVRGDEHGLGVAREFARCLRQRRRALDQGGDGLDLVEPPESAVDWLQALIADMLPSVPPHARAVLQHELAEHLAMHDQGEEAVAAFRHARQLLEAAKAEHDVDSGRWLAAFVRVGESLAAIDRHEEALGEFDRALIEARTVQDAFWMDRALRGRARCLEELARWPEAIEMRQDLLTKAMKSNQRRSVAIAREMLGRCLRRAGHLVEARSAYEQSLRDGMHPRRVSEWSDAPACYWLSRIEEDLGNAEGALSWARRHVEAVRRDQGDTPGRDLAIALEQLGDAFAALDLHADAIGSFREALSIGLRGGTPVAHWNPNIPAKRLAASLVADGDIDGARSAWDDLIETLSGEPQRGRRATAIEHRGDLARELGEAVEAERCYRASLEVGMKPTQADEWSPRSALYELASLLSDLGRHDEALSLNDQYLRHADLEQDRRARAIALERRVDILTALGHTDEAIAAARSSLATGMGDGEWVEDWSILPATYRLTKLLKGRRDFEGAIAEWSKAIELLARRDDRRALAIAWEYLGDLRRSTDDVADAERCYRNSLEVGFKPRQAEQWSPRGALHELAALLSDLGRHDEALVLNDRYLHHADLEQERRARAIAFERRSDILLALGRTDEAILAARSSLATGIGDGDWVEDWSVLPATRCLTKLLAGRGDYAGAVAEWTKAIDLLAGRDDRRSLAIAWEYLGDLRRATDDAADAERCYRTSLEVGMQPTQAEEWSPRSALYELASLLSDLGRHDEALVLNDRYLHHADLEQERRSRAIAFERRSDILLALGRTDEAIAAARSSLATGIGDGDWVEDWSVLPATRRLTKLLAGRGDHTGAVAEWTKAIDLLAGRDDRRGLAIAWESKGNLLRSLDDPVQAERCYRTSLEVGMTPTQTARWTPRGPIWELARLYKDQGRVADALAMNDEYLVHAEREGDRRGLAFAWEQRGDIQRVADDPAAAERCYRTSLEVGMQPTQAEEWSPRSVLTELARCALMGESLDGLRACIDLLHDACLKECVIPWTPAALSVLLDMKTAPRADVDSLVDEVQSRFPPSHQPWCRPIVCALAAREIASLHPALARSLMKVAMRHYPAALDAARRATPSPAAPMALIMLTQCPTASFGPDGAIPTDRALKTIARALEAVQAMPDDHWLALQLPLKQASAIRQATGVLQSAPQP